MRVDLEHTSCHVCNVMGLSYKHAHEALAQLEPAAPFLLILFTKPQIEPRQHLTPHHTSHTTPLITENITILPQHENKSQQTQQQQQANTNATKNDSNNIFLAHPTITTSHHHRLYLLPQQIQALQIPTHGRKNKPHPNSRGEEDEQPRLLRVSC